MAVIAKPKAPKQAVAIPDGTYRAQLVEVKEFTNAFGDRLGFVFEIIEGHQAGLQIMRSTSPVLSGKGHLAQIITGLERLVGTECNILAMQSKGKSGMIYSNIERVFR